jgi:uncharacterized membrane protein
MEDISMFARDYRKIAWSRLRGNWGVIILTFLIHSLIVSILPGVAYLILGGPLAVGLCAVVLSVIRTGSTKFETLFTGLTNGFINRMLANLLMSVYLILWSLLLWIPGIVKSYSYAMTFYIMQDNPGIGANEAITRSRQMMNGHKWQLFCLHFSYIGWILLSCLTFGILFLWVLPSMEAATAAFYESIKGKTASAA